MSVIQALKADHGLTYYTVSEAPPPRICYELTNRYPKGSHVEAIRLFEKELEAYIAADRDICTFESWILEGQNIL